MIQMLYYLTNFTVYRILFQQFTLNPPFCWDQDNPDLPLDQRYPNPIEIFSTYTEGLFQIKTRLDYVI